ncbi:MAG TPA: non-ribosomal peptide synthetase, partial [Thermoanaerobaculia bacterium]|nr:non-ribosomal peptide synthetase [Thermoanaerobaculia bacterium]
EGERAQVLVEWSDSARPRPSGPLVHELFSAHAARRPEATAVAGREGRLTYGELEALSNRLAHHLTALGVGPEARVALCMERTLARVVAVVAVLKAGGAYVSLDPGYPRERLAWLIEDARAVALLTQAGLLDRLPPTAARVLCLDGDREAFAGAETPPRVAVLPENLAYVVYTSGSTGRPKGVEVPHAGLLNLVRWHQDLYGVGPEDRGTQVASPAFDASIWELWPYLAAGASSHIPDDETRLSAPGMVRWWSEEGITLAYLPTPLAEGVLEEGVQAAPDLYVRALIIGGDRLRRRPAPGTPFRLMNHYGPAEYSIVTTVCEVPPQQLSGGEGLPTIGRAVDNTQLYVLDAHLRPVGVGVIGELYVGGIGLARGYLGRPDLTAAAFVPHLLAGLQAEAGERLYRTGDLVRWLPDGDLEFLGRVDHQVKLRGMRVELGEIEAALAGHAAVRECAVLVLDDNGRRLVAYVAADPAAAGADELRAFLGESLPAYMVPSLFVFLDALPLTSNGKLDRRALPRPELESAGELFVAPRDEVEARLAALWAETLGLPRVGVNDNFFALGGDSIAAIRLIAKATREGLVLTARQMFEHPTVAGLAAAARTAAPPADAAPSSDDFGWSRDDQDEIAAAIARTLGGE